MERDGGSSVQRPGTKDPHRHERKLVIARIWGGGFLICSLSIGIKVLAGGMYLYELHL
jgi:hypothetical protein